MRFGRRARKPKLVAESDPGRLELLRSQLDDTLQYGWHAGHDGGKFFQSLGPVEHTRHIVEGLNTRK